MSNILLYTIYIVNYEVGIFVNGTIDVIIYYITIVHGRIHVFLPSTNPMTTQKVREKWGVPKYGDSYKCYRKSIPETDGCFPNRWLAIFRCFLKGPLGVLTAFRHLSLATFASAHNSSSLNLRFWCLNLQAVYSCIFIDMLSIWPLLRCPADLRFNCLDQAVSAWSQYFDPSG